MIKFVLICILIALIMFIAKQVSKQYKDRYEAYCDILRFIQDYQLNIGFKKEKIRSLTSKYTDKTNVLGCYNKYLSSGIFDLGSVKLLTDEEKNQIKDYFEKFGNGDYETESGLIKITKSYIEEKIVETKKMKDKWCPMIIKLTFLFSIGLAILFV